MVTRLAVDPRRTHGALDGGVYGGFIEHLGRCIYGGVYEPGSALSDNNGFRQDVLALLRELRVSVLRWPGGNFVSNYHWKDGIGAAARRPARPNLAWDGVETNQFGTDEFIKYCRELNTEPYICLNMGSGSLSEALEWVEYCNGTAATSWVEQRQANGFDKPHAVHWWGLGNEMYGAWQVGGRSPKEYVVEARRWARALKQLDPSIGLVACGEVGWTDWDVQVTAGLADVCDMYSIHAYSGSDDYLSNVLAPHIVERGIDMASAMLWHAAYRQRLPHVPHLAVDEWNVWFRAMDGGLEERYVLQDALAVGTYLNIFVRKCASVQMANLAQLVNAIAPIVTSPDAAVTQPTYAPFLLHVQGHLDWAVDVHVSGPVIRTPESFQTRWPQRIDDLGPFSVVDAAATVDRTRRRLALTLTNRGDHSEPVEVVLRDADFSGELSLRWIEGPCIDTAVPGVQTVEIREGLEPTQGQIAKFTLPPRSFTLIEARLAQ